MIITKLSGGIGNQMFQYAFGRNVANHLNTELKLDITEYEINKNRNFSLNFFNTEKNIATKNEIRNFIPKNKFSKKIKYTLNSIIPLKWKKNINQEKIKTKISFNNISDNTYIEGYWQNEFYFKNIKDIIKKEFTLKKSIIDKYKNIIHDIQNNNSVSIHIRCKDYLSNKHQKIYNNLSLDYYNNAVQNFKGNYKYFIFSDDINWVKNNLQLPYSKIFISQNNTKDYEELILMSMCQNNIIANSTFSWWGAWLNKNKKKVVIAPKKWFVDENINTNDLIPNNWIKI